MDILIIWWQILISHVLLLFDWQVVMTDLEVLAVISASPAGQPISSYVSSTDRRTNDGAVNSRAHNMNEYFYKFLSNLIGKFRLDGKLLEDKGCFIIR